MSPCVTVLYVNTLSCVQQHSVKELTLSLNYKHPHAIVYNAPSTPATVYLSHLLVLSHSLWDVQLAHILWLKKVSVKLFMIRSGDRCSGFNVSFGYFATDHMSVWPEVLVSFTPKTHQRVVKSVLRLTVMHSLCELVAAAVCCCSHCPKKERSCGQKKLRLV